MGSLNTFSDLIYEETGIRTKAITMTSTMIVIEAIRMASVGRSLEDIYQNIQLSFESIVRDQFKAEKSETLQRKKAVIVTCFTGEGVAAKLYQRIMPVINQNKVELIQMQFLERESFKNTSMPYWKNMRSKQLREQLMLIIKISHFFSL